MSPGLPNAHHYRAASDVSPGLPNAHRYRAASDVSPGLPNAHRYRAASDVSPGLPNAHRYRAASDVSLGYQCPPLPGGIGCVPWKVELEPVATIATAASAMVSNQTGFLSFIVFSSEL